METATTESTNGQAKVDHTIQPPKTDAEALILVKNYAMSLGYNLTAEPTFPPNCLVLRHYNKEMVMDIIAFADATLKLNKI